MARAGLVRLPGVELRRLHVRLLLRLRLRVPLEVLLNRRDARRELLLEVLDAHRVTAGVDHLHLLLHDLDPEEELVAEPGVEADVGRRGLHGVRCDALGQAADLALHNDHVLHQAVHADAVRTLAALVRAHVATSSSRKPSRCSWLSRPIAVFACAGYVCCRSPCRYRCSARARLCGWGKALPAARLAAVQVGHDVLHVAQLLLDLGEAFGDVLLEGLLDARHAPHILLVTAHRVVDLPHDQLEAAAQVDLGHLERGDLGVHALYPRGQLVEVLAADVLIQVSVHLGDVGAVAVHTALELPDLRLQVADDSHGVRPELIDRAPVTRCCLGWAALRAGAAAGGAVGAAAVWLRHGRRLRW